MTESAVRIISGWNPDQTVVDVDVSASVETGVWLVRISDGPLLMVFAKTLVEAARRYADSLDIATLNAIFLVFPLISIDPLTENQVGDHEESVEYWSGFQDDYIEVTL